MSAKKPFRAITVRGVSADLARVIRRRADESGESVNRVVIRLLEEGAGVAKKRKSVLHHDLDRFIGAWSRAEADTFDRALQEQRKVDRELWE